MSSVHHGQALLNQVLARRDLEARQKVLKPLLTCDLLILDELGYLSHPVDVGPLLYEVIAGRYEHKATIITSNKSLSTGAASCTTRPWPPHSSTG